MKNYASLKKVKNSGSYVTSISKQGFGLVCLFLDNIIDCDNILGMKKYVLVLLLLLMTSCGLETTTDVSVDNKYHSLIELLNTNEKYIDSSNYYDVSYEMTKIDNGYRYYIYIDNPRVALYNVETIAIEPDLDYTRVMAANVGVFETEEYHMVPNQTNLNKGYVKGLMMSGVTDKEVLELKLMVCWEDKTSSRVNREYFKLKLDYNEVKHD